MISSSLKRLIPENPLIRKDLRTRMRGLRTFILLTMHLVILTFAVGSAYLLFQSTLTSGGNLEQRRIFGKTIFGLIVWIELVMVSFIAPALTSGAISLEHERQTMDLIRVTLVSPAQLVLGKFLPGISFLFLLIFTSIPLQMPAFLIGGVLWQEILLATIILGVTALAFCALGLLISCLIRRTLIATMITYAITIFLVFGVPIVAFFLLFLFSSGIPNASRALDSSPAAEQFLIFIGWLLVSLTPSSVIIATEAALLDQQTLFWVRLNLSGGNPVMVLSPWIPYVILYLFFSMLALWISIKIIQLIDY